MNLKEYLNKPMYAIDRPWVIRSVKLDGSGVNTRYFRAFSLSAK